MHYCTYIIYFYFLCFHNYISKKMHFLDVLFLIFGHICKVDKKLLFLLMYVYVSVSIYSVIKFLLITNSM